MYRFLVKPKWLAFHLVVIGAIVAMINLGLWQLRRLDERKAANRSVAEHSQAAVVDGHEALQPDANPAEWEWRTVRVSGTYLDRPPIEVVNRPGEGQQGKAIVNGLRTDDGTVVAVDRGWLPAAAAVPPTPGGHVELQARVRDSEIRRLGQTADDPTAQLTQIRRIDTTVLAEQFDAPVLPVYLEQISAAPPDDPSLTLIALPPPDEGPHLSYAIQWFIFSVCVAAGWVLAVHRSATPADQRKRRGPPPIDDRYTM